MQCLVSQSCLTFCEPTDCSPSGSPVHGDSPGKSTCPPPGDPTNTRVEPTSPALQVDSLPSDLPWKLHVCYICLKYFVGYLGDLLLYMINTSQVAQW